MNWLATMTLLILFLSSEAVGLRIQSGDSVSIDTPVNDDLFLAGNVVNLNAPVESAVVAGGTVTVNAPVSGDLVVAGGQVLINSKIGGKVIAAGGNLDLLGNVSRNALLAGGQVNINKSSFIGMDVMVAGEDVYTAGTVNGSLIVSAERFQNNGTAGRVEFHRMESRHEEQGQAFSVFGLLMAVGFLVSGLILLRLFPSLFRATEAEMRSSLAWKALGGFLAIIVAMVMIVLMAATFVGLPLAAMLALSLAAALMLSGIFVAHGLGEALASRWSMPEGKWSRFVLGFVLLNILFLLPYIGWLFQIVSASLGVGSILYALQRWQ